MDLLTVSDKGLYCARGGFYIDPWQPVDRAVLTHAHADHARPGSAHYLAAEPSAPVLRHRLGVAPQTLRYGEKLRLGDVDISLHPSGHLLGAAQVRLEADGQVWVVSGDYKRAADPTCAAFEPLRCHVFVTEATFALPIYRWPPPSQVAQDIFGWWEANRAAGRASVLFCYALGKAQRILAELAVFTDRSVFVHGAIDVVCGLYREAGVAMLPTTKVTETEKGRVFVGELVLAPVAAQNTKWLRRIGDYESAFASGWMQVRGERRRRALDRGFVLSDHADWPALLATVEETGAHRVITTHGRSEALARYLSENGRTAEAWRTEFEGEAE